MDLGCTALMYSEGVRPAVPMRLPRMEAASSGWMAEQLPAALRGAGWFSDCSFSRCWACRLLSVYSKPLRWVS